MAITEWSDARLDDLQDEVVAMREVGTNVAVLTTRVENLTTSTGVRLDAVQTEMHDGFIAIHHTLRQRDEREAAAIAARRARRARYVKVVVGVVGSLGSIAAVVEVAVSIRLI